MTGDGTVEREIGAGKETRANGVKQVFTPIPSARVVEICVCERCQNRGTLGFSTVRDGIPI